jgi:hypothetical protein
MAKGDEGAGLELAGEYRTDTYDASRRVHRQRPQRRDARCAIRLGARLSNEGSRLGWL